MAIADAQDFCPGGQDLPGEPSNDRGEQGRRDECDQGRASAVVLEARYYHSRQRTCQEPERNGERDEYAGIEHSIANGGGSADGLHLNGMHFRDLLEHRGETLFHHGPICCRTLLPFGPHIGVCDRPTFRRRCIVTQMRAITPSSEVERARILSWDLTLS
jgi:hypothetical protein